MILLQIANNTLSTSESNLMVYGFWFFVELILIIGVIIYQVYHSRIVFHSISELKRIFKHPLVVKSGYIERSNLNNNNKSINDVVFIEEEENSSNDLLSDQKIVKISITESTGLGIICRIKDDINNYLFNNYGAAVNFSIIKDIIDREVDIKDEEISHSIPTPLYFGLAATMIGIIFGLWAMPDLNGQDFSKGISALITGVKLAMFGSLSGLLCTTILSSFFYKNAKKELLRDKNRQISYLQAKLLPELIRAEDTGVSGLKASLDRFAREATKISDNVNSAAIHTGMNIKAQQDLITKIESINMLKVSKVNLELFERLEKNMEAFNNFAEFLSMMESISLNLKDFATQTTNIDLISKQILSTVQESRQLNKFLTSHFEKIENTGNSAVDSVNLSDSHFRKAIDLLDSQMGAVIDKLKEETDKRINGLNKDSNMLDSHLRESIEKLKEETDNRINELNKGAISNESKLTEIYNQIGDTISKISSQHLDEFKSVYANSIPQFKQLDNLEMLPKIQTQVAEGAIKFQNESNAKAEKLIECINKLNDSLQSLQDSSNNQPILLKLNSIDENLKKGNIRPQIIKEEQKKSENSGFHTKGGKVTEPLSLTGLLNNLFTTKPR